MDSISISDWVLISTTLFLGALALLTPLIADGIKNTWSKPALSIQYEPSPPGAHKTRMTLGPPAENRPVFDVYYLRFGVSNTGRSQARRCEAVIEEIWYGPHGRGLTRLPNYAPTAMRWGAGYDYYIDINPTRLYYCDFLSVPDSRAQEAFAGAYIDLAPIPTGQLGLLISGTIPFYSQPNRLPPGQYRIKVAVFAENAETVRSSFEVDWPGTWYADEATMLSSVSIRAFASVA